jgi:copper resistance protein C
MRNLHLPAKSALERRRPAAVRRARHTRSRLAIAAALPLMLPFGAGMAHAHALLDHADPRVGNMVKSPHMVSLWFTQNLEGSFSDIQVLDAGGARVSTGHAAVDTSDHKLLRVPVKALPAGKYTVKWHVLSVDTHITEGNFTFNVEP